MTGSNIIDSKKISVPKWGLHDRTKLAWFPGRDVDFKGSSSPPATKYKPKPDNIYFKNEKHTQSKMHRFHLPSSVTKL